MRQQEIDWLYGGGAGALQPWAWQRFFEHLDPEERQAPVLGYYRRLLSTDAAIRDAAVSTDPSVYYFVSHTMQELPQDEALMCHTLLK